MTIEKAILESNMSDLVAYLKENGPEGMIKKHTLLTFAAANGSPEIVRVLVQAGADPLRPNAEGKTAIEVAMKAGKHESYLALRTLSTTRRDVSPSMDAADFSALYRQLCNIEDPEQIYRFFDGVEQDSLMASMKNVAGRHHGVKDYRLYSKMYVILSAFCAVHGGRDAVDGASELLRDLRNRAGQPAMEGSFYPKLMISKQPLARKEMLDDLITSTSGWSFTYSRISPDALRVLTNSDEDIDYVLTHKACQRKLALLDSALEYGSPATIKRIAGRMNAVLPAFTLGENARAARIDSISSGILMCGDQEMWSMINHWYDVKGMFSLVGSRQLADAIKAGMEPVEILDRIKALGGDLDRVSGWPRNDIGVVLKFISAPGFASGSVLEWLEKEGYSKNGSKYGTAIDAILDEEINRAPTRVSMVSMSLLFDHGGLVSYKDLLAQKLNTFIRKSFDNAISDYAGADILFESLRKSEYGIEVADESGKTLLMMAARRADYSICNILIEAGANPLTEDASGKTALMHAAAYSAKTLEQITRKEQCADILAKAMSAAPTAPRRNRKSI